MHRQPHHPALLILARGIERWLASVPITIPDQVVTRPLHLQAIISTTIYEQFDIGWNNAF
jgi:hypothetical protein